MATVDDVLEHLQIDSGKTKNKPRTIDNVLAHFGVRGMRWGVRRSDVELARAAGGKQPASEDAIKAVTAAAKVRSANSLNVLSSAELQTLVKRMNLEQQYVDLTTPKNTPVSQKGEGFVKKFIKNEVNTFQQTGAASKGVQLLASLLDQKSKAVGYTGAGKRALRAKP